MTCIKILKEIFKGFMISQTDLVDGMVMDENDFEHYASRLMIYGLLRRVEKDGDIYWRCEKTHDAHKWDEVLDDFITLAGGIGVEEGAPTTTMRPRAKVKVSPSEKVSKYKNSTNNPPSEDDLPVCSECGNKLTWKFHILQYGSYYRSSFVCDNDDCSKTRFFKKMDYMKENGK
jgi:hypothetical protein